ncbi:MAG TPA: acyl-CoA dehydrogenase [Actinobacteria bacterium]|nr:acyl-CoA dehydrogenase [Actinomycetota bacterium]
MSSLILSRRDLDFLLFEWLGVDDLTKRERFAEHSRDTFEDILDLAELIATNDFAPHNKKNDSNEPTFDGTTVTTNPEVAAAVKKFSEAGFIGSTMDEEVGGMQLPSSVAFAAFAWFAAANVGSAGYPMLTMGNANLIISHGTQEQIDTFVRPMVEGRYFGTMCLSEPQAGSSLADVATRAEEVGDGTYRLFGNKMWISGGDHELTENIVHLVLARIPGSPAGVKGLSLFIVPKYLINEDGTRGERNDVALAGLNHKMGQRGITNTLLNFGEGIHSPGGQAGAIGYLVGEPNRGLAYMFHMMNEARIAVGMGATSLGYTGYLHALQYAKERPQGRPVLEKDPTSPQIPIIEHADVRRMLLAQKAYAEGAMALTLYCGRLVDEQHTGATEEDRRNAELLLDLLTPIVKSWPSQWCLEANSLAIQVHGGYGYTREYNVEQFYRDNRLNPIHEGTHGIQGLDLLGRKVLMQDGAALKLFMARVQDTVDRGLAQGGEVAEWAGQLSSAINDIAVLTAELWGSGQFDVVLANASAYLEAFGHIVLAWIWLEQAEAAAGNPGDFYQGKLQAARYFFATELPKTGPQIALLRSLDRTSLDMQANWF